MNTQTGFQFLNDITGKTSLMRLAVFFIVVVYTVTWAVISVKNNQLQYVDIDQVIMVIGPLFAKATQAFAEHKKTGEQQ